MQPEFSPTPRSGEQVPVNTTETGYDIPPNYALPEVRQESDVERSMERSPVEMAPQPPQQPAVSSPFPANPIAPNNDTSQSISSNPISANDDDVIEKEWVSRAKQILSQTRDDPYAREKAINELQKDYLMKRYGKQLGSATD